MPDFNREYEEVISRDARAMKEDALRELSTYQKEQAARVSGAVEEPKALTTGHNFTISQLIAEVEKESAVGRGLINGISAMKGTLAKGGA